MAKISSLLMDLMHLEGAFLQPVEILTVPQLSFISRNTIL